VQKLGPAELGDLLEAPFVAVLATYRMDGSVLLSPYGISGATAASTSSSARTTSS
jgi:hypothetical protein